MTIGARDLARLCGRTPAGSVTLAWLGSPSVFQGGEGLQVSEELQNLGRQEICFGHVL